MELQQYKEKRQIKRIAFSFLLLLLCYSIYKVQISTLFYPVETWFDQFPVLIKYYNNTLSLRDLFTRYGEHGLLFENCLFLLNANIFNLSSIFEAVITISIPFFSLMAICHSIAENRALIDRTLSIISVGVLCVFLLLRDCYALGMNIQVRIGFLTFVLVSILIDKAFHAQSVTIPKLIVILSMMFVSINICGTLYSTAGIPMICVMMMYNMYEDRRWKKENVIIVLAYIVFSVLYCYEYKLFIFDINHTISGGDILTKGIGIITHPIRSLKSFIAWGAGSFIQIETITENFISDSTVLIIGSVLLLTYIYSIILYIRTKLYRTFYLPAFFIGYSAFVWLELQLGRSSDWLYCINAWYTLHAKLLPAGSILIYVCVLSYRGEVLSELHNKRLIQKTVSTVGIIMIAAMFILSYCGTVHELRRAPYVKEWHRNKLKYLYVKKKSDMPVDDSGNTPLLNNLEMTMTAIDLMREHRLNLYYNEVLYEEINHIYNMGTDKEDYKKISGFYDDAWMAENAELVIMTHDQGKIVMTLYNPIPSSIGKTGIITIDQKEYPIKIADGEFTFEAVAPTNKIVNVKFDFSSFATQVNEIDKRILSVVFNNITSF